MKSNRLRWKRFPRETGLSSIGSGPRGSELTDGKREYASTFALAGDWRGPLRGWCWSRGSDDLGPWMNTHATPVKTEEEAKALAEAWVRAALEQKGKTS